MNKLLVMHELIIIVMRRQKLFFGPNAGWGVFEFEVKSEK